MDLSDSRFIKNELTSKTNNSITAFAGAIPERQWRPKTYKASIITAGQNQGLLKRHERRITTKLFFDSIPLLQIN